MGLTARVGDLCIWVGFSGNKAGAGKWVFSTFVNWVIRFLWCTSSFAFSALKCVLVNGL